MSQTRNSLLADIVVASGGTVTDPNNRNALLYDWLVALGGGTPAGITIDGKINIVVIGASIMEQSFSDEYGAAQSFYNNDLYTEVFERATSGDRIADLLVDLPSYLAEFAGQESNTIFFVHVGGNDISVDGPYPGGSSTINTEYREVLQDILDAGFFCAASSVTYRIPPASNPSEPYNINIFNPAITDLLPLWVNGAIPIINLYQEYFDNQGSWIEPDGIHPNATGEQGTRDYVALQVSGNVTQTNRPTFGMNNTVVQVGNASFPNKLDANGGSITEFSNVDGSGVFEGSMVMPGTVSENSAGRGNAGDTSISLTNNNLLSDSAFIGTADVITTSVDVGDFSPTDTFTVRVTASRDTTATDRKTDFLVGGITKQLDAAAVTPEILEWTGVLGQDLFDDGIQWNRATGSLFGYLSGIQIIKE